MRILLHSYFPITPSHWGGGAQAYAIQLVHELVSGGMQVRVVCPKQEVSLPLLPGIDQYPSLFEANSLPLTLEQRLSNMKRIEEHLAWADIVWTIDEPLPVLTQKPILLSLQTMGYPQELQALLGLNWSRIVCPSEFLANCVREVAQTTSFTSGATRCIDVIPNGVNLREFRRVENSALFNELGLDRAKKYLLFPHRPDPVKGFDRALEVMSVVRDRELPFVLLVPCGPSCPASNLPRQTGFYRELRHKIESAGLDNFVKTHRWIAPHEMSSYLSLGWRCLVLSILPEGFGFLPSQAIACGTPVVSSRAGALRAGFPANCGVSYFDSFDPSFIVDQCVKLVPNSELSRGRAFVEATYSLERAAEAHFRIFESMKKNQKTSPKLSEQRRLRVAPWWFIAKREQNGDVVVWHDLRMDELVIPQNLSTELLNLEKARERGRDLSATELPPLFENFGLVI